MLKPGELSWDDPTLGIDETVTETDAKAAEGSGKPPVGKYLCTCVKSVAVQNDMAAYSCTAANLTWKIEQALEIEGRIPKPGEGDEWIGKFIFDKVNMYKPAEKDGMRNRRIIIAKRIGLITGSGGNLTAQAWGYDIIGKQAVIDFIEETYTDKKTNTEKSIRKVGFSGYENADTVTAVTTDDFDDI